MAPLESGRLRRVRRSLLRGAAGSVLEIGAGTGVNLRYYDSRRVSSLTLSDLDDRRLVLTERVRRDCPDLEGRVAVTRIDAQRLPFSDGAFDTVVATLLFCSVECPPCGWTRSPGSSPRAGGTSFSSTCVRNTPALPGFSTRSTPSGTASPAGATSTGIPSGK
jgi:SAM-dependent methyltransferase